MNGQAYRLLKTISRKSLNPHDVSPKLEIPLAVYLPQMMDNNWIVADKNGIRITGAGQRKLHEEKESRRKFWAPIAIDSALSVAAIVISIIALCK